MHAISQVFTGACYDILADMFENYVTYEKRPEKTTHGHHGPGNGFDLGSAGQGSQ